MTLQTLPEDHRASAAAPPIVVPWGVRRAALGTAVVAAAILLGIAVLLATSASGGLSDATSVPMWAVLLSTLLFQVALASTAYVLGPGRRYGLRPLFGPRRLSSRALFGWGAETFSAGNSWRWVPIVGPCLGGLMAGLLYDALLGRPPRETATDPIYELPRATPAAPAPAGKPPIEVDAEAKPKT